MNSIDCLSENPVDTLCFGGGGVTGLSYIGCIDILEKEDWFDFNKIKTYVGTSIGTLLSFLYIIGYSNNDVKEFIIKFDLNKIEPTTNCLNLFNNFGLDNGEKILELGKTFLYEKFNVRDITFIDLYNLTNKKFRIIVTNFTKSSIEIFDHNSQPNMSVLLAIRISMSLPFIFTPVFYNGCHYVDGALLRNFGIEFCDPQKTIGLTTSNLSDNKADNLLSYISGLCQVFLNAVNKRICPKKFNFVRVSSNISESTNFTFDEERKKKLILNGQESAKLFLDELEVKNTLSDIISRIN